MTPKEKAKELVDKYWVYLRAGLMYDDEAKEDAKHCALIAVDEMMEVYASALVALGYSKEEAAAVESPYLKEVKQEIEKI